MDHNQPLQMDKQPLDLSTILLQVVKLNRKQQTLALSRLIHKYQHQTDIQQIIKLKPYQYKNLKFDEFNCTKIAFMVNYDGSEFMGLSAQQQDYQLLTVENLFLEALKETFQIPRENYMQITQFNRCGRTDTGVSGIGQVFSFYIRCNFDSGHKFKDLVQIKVQKGEEIDENSANHYKNPIPSNQLYYTQNTFNYIEMVNKHLPSQLMYATQYSFVADNFDARFSAQARKYIYLLPKICDLNKIQSVSQLFIGEKDFRNVCYQKVEVQNYVRKVMEITVQEDNELFYVNIKGSAFLYHQVRCMICLISLLCIDKINSTQVNELFNMQDGKFKELGKKPYYQLAPAELLIFNGVEYNQKWDLKWVGTHESNIDKNMRQQQCYKLQQQVKQYLYDKFNQQQQVQWFLKEIGSHEKKVNW